MSEPIENGMAYLNGLYLVDKGKPACLIYALDPKQLEIWKQANSGQHLAWVETTNFKASANEVLLLPDSAGGLSAVLLGLGRKADPFALAVLPRKLPPGHYRLDNSCPADVAKMAPLAWALGHYRFTAYRSHAGATANNAKAEELARLVVPAEADIAAMTRMNRAVFLARNLINTPAEDMGPDALHQVMQSLADTHGADFSAIVGDDLLAENYPMIHAVGRAAAQAPRLLDVRWGRQDAPRVTLVGKGVCFDTGGLNLKTGNYMDLMKKDMGGAALCIALADAIMAANMDVRLRVLVGAVENAIGPGAFRPGDVLASRNGMSVEIGNTDAEGRLVLADMLAEADGEQPEIMVDFATLTGAARVAMGPEVIPFYTHDDALAEDIMQAGASVHDPMWRMPLWPGYDGWLDSQIADVSHIGSSPMGGSITAALFLARFVKATPSWMHVDVYAWNAKSRPGRPVGGEAQSIRAVLQVLEQRFGNGGNG